VARKHGPRGFYPGADRAQHGGLFAYAASAAVCDQAQSQITSGEFYKAATAADLPASRPTKFELFVKLTTARALNTSRFRVQYGCRATKVIE
jgi:hypothetical protein